MTTHPTAEGVPAATLAAWVADAKQGSLAILDEIDVEALDVPYLAVLNPFGWELCHVAWFQENWVLRRGLGRPPLDPRVDALYDSATVGHERRWNMPCPGAVAIRSTLEAVRDGVLGELARGEPSPRLCWLVQLTVFHEDMHVEAFTMMRQVLGLPAPTARSRALTAPRASDEAEGDAHVGGGAFRFGAEQDGRFVFDNEKWAHDVTIAPFDIARRPVTQGEFLAFVEDGGYARQEAWSPAGWSWRQGVGAVQPVYWRRDGEGSWLRRHFDRWVGVEPDLPMAHVNWFEADAWCRWAGRRLPSEAEWEAAASAASGPVLTPGKRRHPWGDEPASADHANLDVRHAGCVPADAFPQGDSGVGCRQLFGNAWEWTATTFQPYPGFVADPYEGYSQPFFGVRKVLRGGSWASRSRMLRNTWRNYYTPDRRDAIAGFRTCALAPRSGTSRAPRLGKPAP